MIRRLTYSCLLILLIWTPFLRAGGLLKVDETFISGDFESFDGQSVVIRQNDGPEVQTRQTIPLQDILLIHFASDSATTMPAPPRRSTTPNQPANETILWRVVLVTGEQLNGNLHAWANDRISFQLSNPSITLQIPTSFISEIWHAPVEMIRKAKAVNAASTSADVAHVMRDDQLLTVKGTALGIAEQALSFRHEEQDRKINVTRLVGVQLVSQASPSAPWRTAFYQTFRMANGDMLPGYWTEMKNGSIFFKTFWDQAISLPTTAVASIDNRNGRVVYLSDLKPIKVEQTPYFDRIVPWRNDSTLNGSVIKLSDGLLYARGVAMHSRTVLEYDLGGRFEQFKARFGFEPTAGVVGRVAVRVLVDGRPKFENSDARSDQKAAAVDVDVRNASRLVLEVDFGEDQDVGDRVIWANARLFRPQVGK